MEMENTVHFWFFRIGLRKEMDQYQRHIYETIDRKNWVREVQHNQKRNATKCYRFLKGWFS